MTSAPFSSRRPVRIAIIGTGGMATGHARHFQQIPGSSVIAAVDVDEARVRDFAKTYSIPEVYTSVDDLLATAEIDAVSVVTPDPFHASISIACLKAGKHVMCEKPLATCHEDAVAMVKAAKKAGTVNLVNFSYRNWPAIHAVAEKVHSGALGEIRHVEASYHQAWLVSHAWGVWQDSPGLLWRLSTEHGSKGTLGDVGVHILDFATYPVGPVKEIYCQLKTFKKAPRNRIGKFKLDANDSAVITVEFANGALGSIQTTRFMTGHINRLFLKISGTEGSVCIDSDIGTDTYTQCTGKDIHTDTWKTVKAKKVPSTWETFVKAIRKGESASPDFARGAEIQKYLDASFDSNEKRSPVVVRR